MTGRAGATGGIGWSPQSVKDSVPELLREDMKPEDRRGNNIQPVPCVWEVQLGHPGFVLHISERVVQDTLQLQVDLDERLLLGQLLLNLGIQEECG